MIVQTDEYKKGFKAAVSGGDLWPPADCSKDFLSGWSEARGSSYDDDDAAEYLEADDFLDADLAAVESAMEATGMGSY